MERLTTLSKFLIVFIILGAAVAAVYTRRDRVRDLLPRQPSAETTAPGSLPTVVAPATGKREVTVAISQWPGHMALVVGAGGLTTQPGSAAAAEGLNLRIVFIEDAPSKNKALIEGKVDAVWETVDELPIALSGFKAASLDARAFIQI